MTDRDFDVNTELMADGVDDEATLEEEETLEEGEGFNAAELDDLQKVCCKPICNNILRLKFHYALSMTNNYRHIAPGQRKGYSFDTFLSINLMSFINVNSW